MEGEYSYIVPENVDLEKAKQIALERLKTQLIADEFGTTISQSNSTLVKNSNGESEVDFLSIGGSEVKGEWIETIGKPRFDISCEENMLVVRVAAKGRIREIVSASVDFKALVLRNGTDDKFESNSFKSGDDLFMSFQSPVDGYLVVYLIDADQQAYCLLPYQNMKNGSFHVEANKKYVLFSAQEVSPELKPYIDEYTMTCSRKQETNIIYTIFSTNIFTKAVDNKNDESLPRELSYEEFQKWLIHNQNKDRNITYKMTTITINK